MPNIVIAKALVQQIRSMNGTILVLFEVAGGQNICLPATVGEITYRIEKSGILAACTSLYEARHGHACALQHANCKINMILQNISKIYFGFIVSSKKADSVELFDVLFEPRLNLSASLTFRISRRIADFTVLLALESKIYKRVHRRPWNKERGPLGVTPRARYLHDNISEVLVCLPSLEQQILKRSHFIRSEEYQECVGALSTQ